MNATAVAGFAADRSSCRKNTSITTKITVVCTSPYSIA